MQFPSQKRKKTFFFFPWVPEKRIFPFLISGQTHYKNGRVRQKSQCLPRKGPDNYGEISSTEMQWHWLPAQEEEKTASNWDKKSWHLSQDACIIHSDFSEAKTLCRVFGRLMGCIFCWEANSVFRREIKLVILCTFKTINNSKVRVLFPIIIKFISRQRVLNNNFKYL